MYLRRKHLQLCQLDLQPIVYKIPPAGPPSIREKFGQRSCVKRHPCLGLCRLVANPNREIPLYFVHPNNDGHLMERFMVKLPYLTRVHHHVPRLIPSGSLSLKLFWLVIHERYRA